ncbi:MAG: hypothetical protein QM820_06335 [Minicystis sp.]
MQALTVTIGPSGIELFAKTVVAPILVACEEDIKPPPQYPSVADFDDDNCEQVVRYSNIHIRVTDGTFSGLSVRADAPCTQEPGGLFEMRCCTAGTFTAHYTWSETYDRQETDFYMGNAIVGPTEPKTYGPVPYTPIIEGLTTTFTLALAFDDRAGTYEIDVKSCVPVAGPVVPNIPPKSVIQHEDDICFTGHVSDATTKMFQSIDFEAALDQVVPSVLGSIPDSGRLTDDIVFDFGVGDLGITYPNDAGISVGVTGTVRCNGQEYVGPPPAQLGLPPVPDRQHHLRMYVSDYEINALHWAYFESGRLGTTVTPESLDQMGAFSDALYTDFYTGLLPDLYGSTPMHARVEPNLAPVASFQDVYVFTVEAKEELAKELPADVYQKVDRDQGRRGVLDEGRPGGRAREEEGRPIVLAHHRSDRADRGHGGEPVAAVHDHHPDRRRGRRQAEHRLRRGPHGRGALLGARPGRAGADARIRALRHDRPGAQPAHLRLQHGPRLHREAGRAGFHRHLEAGGGAGL